MNRLLALFLLMAACATTTGAKKNRDVEVVGRAFHSTVTLERADGRVFCSGVIVNHQVLTADHCIAHGEPVFVGTVDGRWEAAVASRDHRNDLALLLPADGRLLRKGVRIARWAPRWADEVWVIGHPLGTYEYSITRGIVSHPRRTDGIYGGLWMQHDAGSVGGNSGGPVLNKHGRLVGIISFGVLNEVACAFNCPGIYESTHIEGAVHHEAIRNILFPM